MSHWLLAAALRQRPRLCERVAVGTLPSGSPVPRPPFCKESLDECLAAVFCAPSPPSALRELWAVVYITRISCVFLRRKLPSS